MSGQKNAPDIGGQMNPTMPNPGRSPETSSAVTATAESVAQPEFGTLSGLRSNFGIPRSSAYELAALHEIHFVRMRKRGRQRGRVLVDFDSVRAYLARCAEANK